MIDDLSLRAGDKSEDGGGDLRDARQRLALMDSVLRALPLGVAVLDEKGQVVVSNGAENAFAVCGAMEPVLRTTSTDIRVHDQIYTLRISADVTEQQRTEADLFRRASYDDLTGLPNRSLLQQTVERLIGEGNAASRFALAFIDVDNFKHINDFYNHGAGDEILRKIASRLSSQLRPTDLLARIGGDEFVLLLSPVSGTDADIGNDLKDLLDRLKQPFFVDGHEVFASVSTGVSLFPEHGRDFATLRRNADIAMYRVKGASKGALALFNAEMSDAATARMRTEQRLRLAILDRQFCCAFQPKVDIRSREVVGLEVLLRWRDEQGLIHAPGDFIGLAVELGLINDIAFMVLDQTMAALDQIDDTFGPNTRISLNVAASQAGDHAFMTAYARALGETGRADRFMIELTEEAFIAKGLLQDTVLPLFRAMGTRISIDDFGVGYSSLSALAELTADEIKIDRSFITSIHQRARSQIILKGLESLGHALGMTIIAEGLETAEELAYLQAATRIRYAQGFYFSKPIFLDQLVGRRTVSYAARPHQVERERVNARSAFSRR